MAKTESDRPWRVIALSLALAVVFAAMIWLLLGGGGRDGGEGQPSQTTATPSGAEGEVGGTATESATDPAAGAATGAPLPEESPPPGTTPATGSESREGGPPSLLEQLESLSAAAQERAASGTMTLRLYLVVPTVEVLVPVSRDLEAPPTLDAQVQRAVEELIAWTGGEMISPLPPEAVVREVWVSPGGIAFVDFDAALPDYLVGGSLEELHAVYGVVATVTSSFPEIRAVHILIGGEQAETMDGHVDVSRPLLPQYDMVMSDRRRR